MVRAAPGRLRVRLGAQPSASRPRSRPSWRRPEPPRRRAAGRRAASRTSSGRRWTRGEIGVLKGQCLDRRIDSREELEREIAAWERKRNAAGARVNWMFTTEKARTKMGRAYPKPTPALGKPAKES